MKKFLDRAVGEALKGIKQHAGGPFGAVIVKKGKMIARGHNTVLKTKAATRHAEINAIEMASRKLKSFDLSHCVIYSTTEPCPMCFSAIHWARIDKVVYGTSISDVKKLGFNELSISNTKLKKWGKSKVKIQKTSHQGCRDLLKRWKTLPNTNTY